MASGVSSSRPRSIIRLGDHLEGHVEIDRHRELLAEIGEDPLEGVGLVGGAGEPVEEHPALHDVGLGQPLGDDAVHDVVGHQIAGVHHRLGLPAELGPSATAARSMSPVDTWTQP